MQCSNKKLSYELYPDRASEKYWISLLKKKKDKVIITNNMIDEMPNLNINKNDEINIIDTIINNITNENNKEKESDNQKIKIRIIIQKVLLMKKIKKII